MFDALKAIGEPAKEFLLRVLHAHPITGDNERAAVALMKFRFDPDVSAKCLKMLHQIDLNKYLPLATYLVLACEGLSTETEKEEFSALGKIATTPKSLCQDIDAVMTHLKSRHRDNF